MKRLVARALPVLLTLVVCVAAEEWPQFHAPRLVQLLALLALVAWGVARVRGPRRDALLGLFSLLLALVVVEGACVALEAPTPSFEADGLDAAKPVVGYGASHPGTFSFRKRLPDGTSVCDVRVTIAKNGLRETKAATAGAATVFFGDSFTFGDCVGDADTLPQSYADLRKRAEPVVNLGFSGWSPAQNLAVLQNGLYRDLLDKPKRFVLVTAAFHIERTSCKAAYVRAAPRYVLDDTLHAAGSCRRPVRDALMGVFERSAAFRRLVYPLFMRASAHDVATYVAVVDAFVKEARRAYDAPVTILYLPSGDGYLAGSGYTEAQLEAALAGTGADLVVDHLPTIANPALYVIAHDGHPTGLANRARAAELAAHLDALAPPPPDATKTSLAQ